MLRIGCGSAYAEDRLEPAIDLADRGALDYLCMDSLAERTLAIAQQRRNRDSSVGYDTRIPRMIKELFPVCLKNGVTVIGNMGSANPTAAAHLIAEGLRKAGHTGARIGLISGDDVLDLVRQEDPMITETGCRFSELRGNVVSANAYLGADPIVSALRQGANIVVGGRIADHSLYLGPMMHEFAWESEDWEAKGRGQAIGHLLECGSHTTGGNFADPPYREVPRLTDLGNPLGEVTAEGEAVITKLPKTGGAVTVLNCKSQLLHEIHDPANYLTPDVVVDLTGVRLEKVGPDRVKMSGARGRPWPETLKVLVGILEGWVGEGEISYAGDGAYERAQLAVEIINERKQMEEMQFDEFRVEMIGMNSLHGSAAPGPVVPYEVRLRVAGRTTDRDTASWLAQEVEYLNVSGPSAGAGCRRRFYEVLAMYSTYVPRDKVGVDVQILEV
ncbi:MAG: acyclic terpene utilization AtuA family protein [Dehalococcoidia bacterium]